MRVTVNRTPHEPPAFFGALLIIGGSAAVTGLTYATNIALAWLISPAEYGTLAAILALSYVVTPLLVLGFPWAIVRYLPSESDLQARATLVKTAMMGNAILGVVCVVAYAAIALAVFHNSPLSWTMHVIMAATILALSLRTVYYRVLTSTFQFLAASVAPIVEASSRLAVSFLLVLSGYGVEGALGGQLVSGILALLAAHYFLRHMRWWRSSGRISFHVIKFSLALLPSGLGITLLFEVDVLLLKVLGKGILLDEAVGHYQAARVAAMVVPFVASAVMTAVSPYIAKYSGTNRHSSYIRETLRYTALFSLPAATVLVVFPGSLLHAFFPAEYTSAATTLAILASRGLFLATLQVLSNALQSSGRIWWLSIVLSLAAVLELLLLWLVVPKYGLVGAAIGATVPVVLATTTLLLQEARTHHLIPPVRSTMKLATALGGLVAFLVVFPHGSRLLVFLDLLLAGIVYLLLLIRLRLIRVADIESLHQALAPIPAAQPMLRIMHRMLCRLGGHQHRPGSSA